MNFLLNNSVLYCTILLSFKACEVGFAVDC